MKSFVFTFLIGLFACMGLNYFVDPSYRWYKSNTSQVHISEWTKNEVLLVPVNFDEYKFKRMHIHKIGRPDLLVLGSSKAYFIDSSMFRSGIKLFNASGSNSTLRDYIWILEEFRLTGKFPKNILIYLDPWVIQNSFHNVSFYRFLDLYDSFQRRHSSPLEARLRAIKNWILRVLQVRTELRELTSWSVLKSSWEALWHKQSTRDMWKLVPLQGFSEERSAYRYDGSRLLPARLMKPAVPWDKMEAHFKELTEWELDPKSMHLFHQLLEDARSAGSHVYILLPPFAPSFMEEFKASPNYANVMKKLPAILDNLKKEGLADDVCFAIQPENFGCGKNEFMDGIHALPSCVIKILRSCLQKSPYWNSFLRK